jgi:hypothetical protein
VRSASRRPASINAVRVRAADACRLDTVASGTTQGYY